MYAFQECYYSSSGRRISERELNIVHAELWSCLVRDDSGNCADLVLMFRRSYCVNPTDLIADLEENHRDWNVLRGHRTSLLELPPQLECGFDLG